MQSHGRLEGVLNGSQYNRAWEVHEFISDAKKRLSKLFRCQTRLGRLSNELQEATLEDPDHISCEAPIYLEFYRTYTDETYK